jgi:hypothetical protein
MFWSDGSYYFYDAEEDVVSLFSSNPVLKGQKKGVIRLPAVYEMSLAEGLRIIRCPFFSWLSAFDTIAFQSRYTLGSLVGYFYHPKPGYDYFLVLQNEVTFNTVDDDNECVLTCVDIKGTWSPHETPEGEIVPAGEPAEIVVDLYEDRVKTWKETYYVITTFIHDIQGEQPSSWKYLMLELWKSADKNAWETEPTFRQAFDALRKWNPHPFTKERLRETSPEQSNFNYLLRLHSADPGGPDERIPILYSESYNPHNEGKADVVTMRHPFLPEYSKEGKL